VETCLQAIGREYYPTDARLHQACRYALATPGKRIRPLLVYAAHLAAGGDTATQTIADKPAMAIEMVHTYSLVHDDLPTMDNDDWRRGRATVHREFDEAIALLAGDTLLSDAFAVLTAEDLPGDLSARMVRELAGAIGGQGMAYGQSLDLWWTNRDGYQQVDLDQIHHLKTACLIAAASTLGALSAGAAPDSLPAFRQFGWRLGLAFQIVDDLLDDQAGTGKSQGKDQAQGKLTYLSLMPRHEAEQLAKRLTDSAFNAIRVFGERAGLLRELATNLLQRDK
jgi:geranylgeranyl pyrophosphate synthase